MGYAFRGCAPQGDSLQLTVMLGFAALWAGFSLLVFRAQRRALEGMRASELIPFTARSVLFSCALMGLLLAMGTTVIGTFVWHQFLA
jgi:hypothetical protein